MATPSLLPKSGAKVAKSLKTTEPSNYEAALLELELLVAKLEAGQLPLEQLMEGYQRGALLLTFCRKQLEAVEDQISVIDNDQMKPWTAA